MTESRLKSLSDRHFIRDMKSEYRLSDDERDEYGIIYPSMKDQSVLNAFRELRGKLLRFGSQNNFVCLVSTIDPFGDSSWLTINLATVFAFDRSKSALVIDCDTGYNLFDKILPQSQDTGLVDFIEHGYDDLRFLIHESGIPRLRIIPAGGLSETRAESFESSQMRTIVAETTQRYPDRFVFVNGPNMRSSSEVQSLANITDMVVFEVPYATVLEEDVRDAIQTIGQQKVAGIVFKQ